ncbi:type II toxin-antitoxin system RelE/ParE family toxin [Shumkonia mesophila]|uniref:type II toxin-antitoxin system RelE/ParE family toxin n=1 Tax=Shumkonia mesophila TaxID=2838854 RepID=UPI0029343DB9|nr:type II toxin-antitoxin system RelE/ParE family toxin [Shumkonia mesophila]
MTKAVLSPQARRDLLDAIRWIAKDNPAAARALRDGVATAATRIGKHGHIGSLRPELADEPYRFVTLTGFNYVIVYNAERRPPLIVRILHGARDLPEVLRES